jgi:hypothetical protein
MRPSRTVAGAALAAALALGALPGLVGSREPATAEPLDAAAFREINLATTRDGRVTGAATPDHAGRSAGALAPVDAFADPISLEPAPPDDRARPDVGAASASWTWKAARYTLRGEASFYDHGTTAMRLPAGTHVVICGNGGCIERVIDDYGPTKAGGRIVDLYRPDFFRICGCGWWSGTTQVTVRVY